MRPEQLEKARAAAEGFKPKPLDAAANAVEIPNEWLGDETSVATSNSIRDVQLILNESGFDAGSPDGVMGDQTRTAIARFQEDNGLEPTGEVDAALVRTLLARK